MIVYKKERLRHFKFWSGAKDTAKCLTYEELDQIEMILDEFYPNGMSETEINDLFWFDGDIIAVWLGYANFEELKGREEEGEE